MSQLSQFYINTGGGDGVESVQAGNGISVDNTDPKNPIVENAGVLGVQSGSGISVDNTDPKNPVVWNWGVRSLYTDGLDRGIVVNNADPRNPKLSVITTITGHIDVTEGTPNEIPLPISPFIYLRLVKTVGVTEADVYFRFSSLHNCHCYGTEYCDTTAQTQITIQGITTTPAWTYLKIFNTGSSNSNRQYCTLNLHSQSNNNHWHITLYCQYYNSTTVRVFYTITSTKG